MKKESSDKYCCNSGNRFCFTALRQPTSVLLICGFALLAEKDEWLNRQVLQALLLSMAYFLADTVITWAFSIFSTFFRWINAYGAVNAIISVSSFFSSIIYIAMLVFTVLAVIRVARGKDAKLPIIEKMAGGDITAAFTSKSDATGVVSPAQAAPLHRHLPSLNPSPLHRLKILYRQRRQYKLYSLQLLFRKTLHLGQLKGCVLLAPHPCLQTPGSASSAAQGRIVSLHYLDVRRKNKCFVVIVGLNF